MTSSTVMNYDIENDDSFTQPVGRWSVLYYGSGHMLNDITAACWFTYLLLFLTDIGLSPRGAAAVMLSGQIADGFATIFIGELIDRFGHFKIWHGAGSVLVAVSFSSVFGGCMPCRILSTSTLKVETISYCVFAAIFNVGWAATQVAHMSMVNCITLNSTSRVVLTSCRNAFTMVANLSLYAIAFIVFSVSTAKTHADLENQYRWIAYSSIFIGCCFVGIFLSRTEEPRLKMGLRGNSHARISWAYWFKKILYYQVALVYMLTRLVVNVSQAYLAFYVINDLRMGQSAKALVPAIIYICSFIVSILLQVTGISMQNVLIGEDLSGCAFVCGTLSFLDKMSCGIAVYVLQSYQSMSPTVLDNNSSITSLTVLDNNSLISTSYISVTRFGLGLIPAICSLVSVAVTCTMKLHTPYSKPLVEPLLQ
ncbi:major facilitator superfamily domain-containing protein 12 isoform X3 [Citrus clementina]|uniref:major facilitator superfamily domain-containing protein 12 isoform X3 n=1 Tax=Citrus clementina TaxID=85681 RepID=UPI000CED5364|nr:major facilitator superfamily domain-containing protein 12 isoform X3 [Citrus x clementina]